MYKKSLNTKSPVDINTYKIYRNALNRVKRASKVDYYHKECLNNKNNSKKLWQIINKISGKTVNKQNVISCLSVEKIKITESKLICQEFAKHFSTVGANYANKISLPTKSPEHYLSKIPVNHDSVFLYPTTCREIEHLIDNLPCKNSSGYDKISNNFLKKIKRSIINPLTIIFNKSITEGVFPDEMKLADVVSLHKGGSTEYLNNYRPISLLLTISKLLEKIMYSRIYSFLDSKGLLFNSQFGFRSKHSCENAVEQLLSNVIKNNENSRYTIAVYLDLSKAFDTISHNMLLRKLHKYGIRGIALKWFTDYLSDRKMRMKCLTEKNREPDFSEYHKLDYGAPQGSCLGPLLFMIFVNDLHLNLEHTDCILFADDTTIYIGHKDINKLKLYVTKDLKNLSDWFKANKLTLNLAKTVGMIFGKKSKREPQAPEIKIDGVVIPFVDSTKFLGIYIDTNLDWKRHVAELILKLRRNTYMLRCSQNLLNTNCKKMLYYAQIQSHLSYGLIVWGPMVSRDIIRKLQSIQNDCLRLVMKVKDVWPYAHELGFLSVDDLIKLELFKTGYKLHHRQLPQPIVNCFLSDQFNTSLTKRHKYGTRNKAIPNNPKPTTKLYKSSFLCKTITEYSTLLATTSHCKNFYHFVNTCKRRLHEL